MRTRINSYGYYHITLSSRSTSLFIYSNSERAFIVAQLQDLLSPRFVIESIPTYKQLASCIDLLAFSIKGKEAHLLIFSIDRAVCTYLAECLVNRLLEFRAQQGLLSSYQYNEPRIAIKKLKGPHQALDYSVKLHLLHEDWEYDRYSSVGFFLHDRRGDWMRLWRLAQLYENNTDYYRTLLHSKLYNPQAMANSPYLSPAP